MKHRALAARLGIRPRMLGSAACVAILAGCAQPTPPQRPEAALPARYATVAPAASPVLAAEWWKGFGDAALDVLVERTLAANLDLRLAAARIDETAVAVALARSAQWPSVDLGTSASRSRSSTLNNQPIPQATTTTHRVALSTSFEIDLWGRLRDATRSAQEQLLATQHARETVRLALVSSVVQGWLTLRSLDRQMALIDTLQQSRRESLSLVQRRVAGGIASGLDPAQAESAIAALAAQRLELERQRALLVNRLGESSQQPLLALPPSTAALSMPQAVPAGLPSELLTRRPDIQQAEATMRAAFSQFEVTKKSAWPSLTLTGSLGSQSADLLDLVKAGSRIWSIGPSLLVSIFDAGRNEARSAEARARADQAAIGWQQSTLTAFREVSDALSDRDNLSLQEAEVQRQAAAAREAARISGRRYEAGYSGYLDVLDAQRGVQDAELALLRVRQSQLDAQVALIKALGGGWEAPRAAR